MRKTTKIPKKSPKKPEEKIKPKITIRKEDIKYLDFVKKPKNKLL